MYQLKPSIKEYLENNLSPREIEYFNVVMCQMKNGNSPDTSNIFSSEYDMLSRLELVNFARNNDKFSIIVNQNLFTNADWESESFKNDIYHYIKE